MENGASRRQLLAGTGGIALLGGFGGFGAARWPVNRRAAAGRAPGTLLWQRHPAAADNQPVGVMAGYGLVYESYASRSSSKTTYVFDEVSGTPARRIDGAFLPWDAGPGAVYCLGVSSAGQTNNDVVALSTATGRVLWTHDAAFPLHQFDSGLLIYGGERIYYACGTVLDFPNVPTAPSTVGALDARTGRSLWSVALTCTNQEPVAADNAVYASTANGVVALKAETGARLWEASDVAGNDGTLITTDGVVGGNSAESATGLDAATGRTLWQAKGYNIMAATGAAFIALSIPAGDETSVVTTTHALHARSGKSVWTQPLTQNGDIVVVADNGVVYLGGGSDGELLAFSAATGRALWRRQLASPAMDIVVDAGIVFVVDADGTLYALQA